MYKPAQWLQFIALLITNLLPTATFAKGITHGHHSEDSSIGVHGMALIPIGDYWLASHMPLHGGVHGHQLIVALGTEDAIPLRELVSDAQLLSLMPERFSLRALRQGELHRFTATIFRGHFERNGEVLLKDVVFSVHKKLLDLPLDGNEPASGYYQLLRLGDTSLLVHRIGEVPSFDQIIEVSAGVGASKHVSSGRNAPLTADDWPASFTEEGIHFRRNLYLETRDFQ